MTEAQTPADQAPVQSVEDRIAAQFGLGNDDPPEDSAEPQDAEPAAPEPEEVEVEYEGETFRVPRKLQKAIMQERDYTQKNQALAEQRRQVEYAQKAQEASRLEREFHESVAQDIQQVQLLDNYLQQMRAVDVTQLPMEDGFKHWVQLQQLSEQRNLLQQNLQSKRHEFEGRYREHLTSLKSQARELLAKQIPAFSDETLAQLSSHAKSMGYTEADWDMIQTDPRAASLLYKAMKYDELSAAKPTAQAIPVVKPGASNPMPQAVKDKLAFRKAMNSAKSSQDKARLIEQRLAGRF